MSSRLSLPTVSGLETYPASRLTKRYMECGDWNLCRIEALEGNLMRMDKTASAARYIRYIAKLLAMLTNEELILFVDSDMEGQKALLWLAFCRAYPLVGKFADTVINQKFNNHDFSLLPKDWNEFLSRESDEHQELENIGKASRSKARSVIFSNLRSSNYLSSSDTLKEAVIPKEIASTIKQDIRFFPVFMEM